MRAAAFGRRPTAARRAMFYRTRGTQDEGSCMGGVEMGKETAVGSNSTALVAADRLEWMWRRSLCGRPGLGHIFLAVTALERRAVRPKSSVICGSRRARQAFSVISRHAAFFHAAAGCQWTSV